MKNCSNDVTCGNFAPDRGRWSAGSAGLVPVLALALALAMAADLRAQNPVSANEVDKVVSITGDVVSGYGSIVAKDGKTYLVTTSRVLGGNSKLAIKTFEGKELKPTKIALDPKSELVFIEIEGMEGLPVAEDFASAAAERDDFVVLTFAADNSGVVEYRGRLSKIGETTMEGRNTTEIGHTGSPAVHRKTRQFLGVLSNYEAADFASLDANSPAMLTRQVIYRVDNTGELVPTTWGKYLAEAKRLRELRLRSTYLLDAAVEIFKKRFRVEPTRAESERYRSEDPAIQRCIDEYAKGYRENASKAVNDANRESFQRAVLWTVTSDTNKLKPTDFTANNQAEAAAIIAEREVLKDWIESQVGK